VARPVVRRGAMLFGTLLALTATNALPAGADPAQVRIHDIEGTSWLSPYKDQAVTGVPGIVTGLRTFGSSRGYWIQDPSPDANRATSEGLFVYTGSTPKGVAVGDSVQVSGTVSDYYVLNSGETTATTASLPIAELTKTTVTVVSHDNPLPAAVVIKPSAVPSTEAPVNGGATIEGLQLKPTRYALDFWRSMESMRVEVDNARVVGPTDAYNELWVTAKPKQNPTPRGGTVMTSYQQEGSGRLQIQSLLNFSTNPFPVASVGDTLTGATAGPLDYNQFGGFTMQATAMGSLTSGGIKPVVAKPPARGRLSVATYNVENLAPTDPQAKFDRLAQGVVTNLATPDIIAAEEIQDNDGAKDDGVVAADQTLTKLTAAIVAAGGPAYQWREIDPVNDADGGEPGGNIRQVFLFNPARVSFVDKPGGTSTSAVDVVKGKGGADLTYSPGRIDPGNTTAWNASRKPLAGEFVFGGKKVIVIANHLVAKLPDQPTEGRFQPPARGSDAQRIAQTTVLHDFVAKIRKIDAGTNVVMVGDMNDYQFSPALHTLTKGGVLQDLVNTLPRDQRYTYDYEGTSEVLDHILLSPSIGRFDYQIVHVNAEFANQVSDHDPQVVDVALG
jgi:uncharacterized protein